VNLLLINSWNAFLCKSLNHHTRRGQSLLNLTACAWNKKRPSLFFLSHSKINISPAVLFWAWINFLSWKSWQGSHPTLGASENFNEKKRKKTMRKLKRQNSPRNLNAKGHIKEEKWVCLSQNNEKKANQRRAAKEKMKDTKSQTPDSDHQSLKPWYTFWALWIIFFHSQKPQPTLRACRNPF